MHAVVVSPILWVTLEAFSTLAEHIFLCFVSVLIALHSRFFVQSYHFHAHVVVSAIFFSYLLLVAYCSTNPKSMMLEISPFFVCEKRTCAKCASKYSIWPSKYVL